MGITHTKKHKGVFPICLVRVCVEVGVGDGAAVRTVSDTGVSFEVSAAHHPAGAPAPAPALTSVATL